MSSRYAMPPYDPNVDDMGAFPAFFEWLKDSDVCAFHEVRRAYVAHIAQGPRLCAHVRSHHPWGTWPTCFYAPPIYGRRELLYMFGETQ